MNLFALLCRVLGIRPISSRTERNIEGRLSIVFIEPDVKLLLLTFSMTSVFFCGAPGRKAQLIVYNDRALIDEAMYHNVTPIGIFLFMEASRDSP